MNTARRIVAACGIVGAIVAMLNAYVVPSTQWYQEAVVQSTILVVAAVLVLTLMAELLLRFFSRPLLKLFLLIITTGVAAWPNIYLVGAAFYGREQADFQTWHLLSLFTAVRVVEAVVIFGALAAGSCLLIVLIQRLRRKSVA